LNYTGTKYFALCDGISGVIGELIVDKNWVDETVKVSIDTLVVNSNLGEEEDDKLDDVVGV